MLVVVDEEICESITAFCLTFFIGQVLGQVAILINDHICISLNCCIMKGQKATTISANHYELLLLLLVFCRVLLLLLIKNTGSTRCRLEANRHKRILWRRAVSILDQCARHFSKRDG